MVVRGLSCCRCCGLSPCVLFCPCHSVPRCLDATAVPCAVQFCCTSLRRPGWVAGLCRSRFVQLLGPYTHGPHVAGTRVPLPTVFSVVALLTVRLRHRRSAAIDGTAVMQPYSSSRRQHRSPELRPDPGFPGSGLALSRLGLCVMGRVSLAFERGDSREACVVTQVRLLHPRCSMKA